MTKTTDELLLLSDTTDEIMFEVEDLAHEFLTARVADVPVSEEAADAAWVLAYLKAIKGSAEQIAKHCVMAEQDYKVRVFKQQ